MTNPDFLGSSPSFQVDCTVLLRGETGTGTEAVANASRDYDHRA
jgi:transcriptional regulator with GAF, ATPase, and Fis domain